VEERPQEVVRVTLDRAHAVALEEVRERAPHGRAVLDHVGDPGRTAQVVLQDEVAAVAVPDQVRPADVDIDVARDREVHELAPEVLRREDLRGGDHLVLEDLLAVVEVPQEKVERRDPLDEPRLDPGPFLRGDDPRDQVKGEDALGALGVVVDGEGHPAPQEGEVHGRAAPLELRDLERAEALGEAPVVRAHIPAGGVHLVEELACVVGVA